MGVGGLITAPDVRQKPTSIESRRDSYTSCERRRANTHTLDAGEGIAPSRTNEVREARKI